MYSPSEHDAMMILAADCGDLKKLREIKGKFGDDGNFRIRCDLVNDFEGRRVLHYASGNGIIEMCKFLIEEVMVDADIRTDRGDTPLLCAVRNGHAEVAEYLISHGADVATSDYRGFTLLHYSVQRDNLKLTQLLLAKGAGIEAKSVDGTPLQCAALCGCVETVKFLLRRGAKPNSMCMLSGSPLICAIKSHAFECVDLLIKFGADPNKKLHGLSPLALAAAEGHSRCLKSLLASGANPDSVSADGLRPIEHAALKRNNEAIRILFSVSRKIPEYPNWSIDGIMEYIHSEKAKTMREQFKNANLDVMKQQGKSAWSRQDYYSAIRWYSEAIYLDPSDEKLLSNRSLCWARLGEATFALRDAEECVRLKPGWAKAHYMEGAAWKLLKNYRMSSMAFRTASSLAPGNGEIMNAFREIVGILVLEMQRGYPLEASSLINAVL